MSFREHDYSYNSATFNIPTIISLHTYHDCILAYLIQKKILKCDTLYSKLNSLESKSDPSNFNIVLRNIKQVFEKFLRTNYNYAYNSTVFRIARIWNRLPSDITSIDSISRFRVELRNHVIAFH